MNDVAYWSRSICVPLNPLPGTSHTLKSSYISNNTIRMPVPPLKFMRFFSSHLHVHSLQALRFYHHFESQHFSVCILFISILHYILGLLLFYAAQGSLVIRIRPNPVPPSVVLYGLCRALCLVLVLECWELEAC